MDALLVIDMQQGVLATPRADSAAVITRINSLINAVHQRQGAIIFIQHDDAEGALTPFSPGWQLIPELAQSASSCIVRKTACDAFWQTSLQAQLATISPERLLICGCATDYCIDATIKSAATKGFHVSVAADAHTTADRPPLTARDIIDHYNTVWMNWILPGNPIQVIPSAQLF